MSPEAKRLARRLLRIAIVAVAMHGVTEALAELGSGLWLPDSVRPTVHYLAIAIATGCFEWAIERAKARRRARSPHGPLGTVAVWVLALALVAGDFVAHSSAIHAWDPPSGWISDHPDGSEFEFVVAKERFVVLPFQPFWPAAMRTHFESYEQLPDAYGRTWLAYTLQESPEELFTWVAEQGRFALGATTATFALLYVAILVVAALALARSFDPLADVVGGFAVQGAGHIA
jgi:hypothetical protein